MPTINDKKFIDEIIAKDGILYPDDPFEPPIIRIVEYTNAWGKVVWGVIFKGESQLYHYDQKTKYIRNPRVIWQK